MSTSKAAHLATVLAAVLVLAAGSAAADNLLARTKNNGTQNPAQEFQPVSGKNSNNQAATWTAGGHISYTKSGMPPPYPPSTYDYYPREHNSSECLNANCAYGTHALAVVTGSTGCSGGATVGWWFDQRVYIVNPDNSLSLNSADFGVDNPYSGHFLIDGESFAFLWNGADGIVTANPVKYYVGAWQGAAKPWTPSAWTDGW